MRDIFDIDLKGNAGNTIKNIISFSKDVQTNYEGNPGSRIENYIIEVEYYNGKKEKLEFSNIFDMYQEWNCFSEKPAIYYRKRRK